MRCVLLLAAALALWPPAAAHAPPPAHMDHIKRQILAKLGLTARPLPLRAPPRDVVRQILARAADPAPPAPPARDETAREIIAIAHTEWLAFNGHPRIGPLPVIVGPLLLRQDTNYTTDGAVSGNSNIGDIAPIIYGIDN